jgi:secondary thiamine-phosphate synthase enzyme
MMLQHQETFAVETRRGLHDITARVRAAVRASGIATGLCVVYVRHTSASLVIQENADPAVQRDLEAFFRRLVPEGDPIFTHLDEGEEDMPSHVKAALTKTSEQIPISGGELMLGTWQGIFLWEHRSVAHRRAVIVHVTGQKGTMAPV